jgi:hypothetical protein
MEMFWSRNTSIITFPVIKESNNITVLMPYHSIKSYSILIWLDWKVSFGPCIVGQVHSSKALTPTGMVTAAPLLIKLSNNVMQDQRGSALALSTW